jgi:hypothetical protein
MNKVIKISYRNFDRPDGVMLLSDVIQNWIIKYRVEYKCAYHGHSVSDRQRWSTGHVLVELPEEYITLLLLEFPNFVICECGY